VYFSDVLPLTSDFVLLAPVKIVSYNQKDMKRQALEEVVDKHISNIEKHSGRLPGSFDKEDIHDLRVGYKKIRAFIRLLQLEKDTGNLQIPHKLKAVYQAAGKVRDLQLFLFELHQLPIVQQIPESIAHWNRQLFSNKENTVSAIEATHFKKILTTLTGELPRELHDDTVKRFLHQKVAAIHILLLAADSEQDLHSIRKQLKDIIYVIRVFENDWGIPFPIGSWDEKKLSDMAALLGDFNDRCIAISLLQSGYNGNENEKPVLMQLENEWQQLKNIQQQQLLNSVHELRIEHAF
jgi:CHAD domain-containing protein